MSQTNDLDVLTPKKKLLLLPGSSLSADADVPAGAGKNHPHSRGAVLGKRRRVGGSSGRTGADDEAPVAARMPAAMLLVWGRCNWLGGSHRLDPHGIALGRAGKRISLDSTIGPDAACLRGAAFGMAPSPPSTPARPGITPPGGLRRSEAGNRRR